MGYKSGKLAYVNGIPCTTSWGVSQNVALNRHFASCVPDGSAVVAGNIDWSGGAMTGIGYLPPMPTGDNLTFKGVAGGVPTVSSETYNGSILIQETTINIPIAAGGAINWTSSFAAQGALTRNAADSLVFDATRNQGPPSKLGKISIDPDGMGYDDLDGVQNITLTFRRNQTTYVEDGLTYRVAGNLECEMNLDLFNENILEPNILADAIHPVKIYVTDTLFYDINDMIFGNHSGFQVNRDGGSLLGYSVQGMWTGVTGTTPGHIIKPNGAYVWGEPDS